MYLNWHFVNKPEVNINLWGGKQITDSKGDLIDDGVRNQVKKLLEALIIFTKRLNSDKFGVSSDSIALSKSLSEWTREELKAALKEMKKQSKSEKSKSRPE